MSCGPIAMRPLLVAKLDRERYHAWLLLVPGERPRVVGRRRPACHRARPPAAGTSGPGEPVQANAGPNACAVSSGDHGSRRRVERSHSHRVDGWQLGARRTGSPRRALDADRVEHVGGEIGVSPRRWLRPRARADDDDRAVEVEDPQGLDLARFVIGPPESVWVLPASEIGVRPDTVRRLMCASSWCRSPTCRRGRCVGMLCRRSRRWRCPTGRSPRPIPAAR